MKIRINGPIVDDSEVWIYEWYGIEATSPKKVIRQIERAEQSSNDDIEVLINSYGGSVFAASEIYTALKSYKGKVITQAVGIAASAASFLMMAGDEILISPTAQVMIHNALMSNQGDYRSMDKASDILKGVNQSIVSAYQLKTGKNETELLQLMAEETWMTAKQAVESGFADKVMFEDEASNLGIVANHDGGILPREVINRMKEMVASGTIDLSSGSQEGSVENPPISQTTNLSNQVDPQPTTAANTNLQGDEEEMDLEKIKNDYPDLYETIKNEGIQEGVKAENERIKAIEDLAYPGIEDLVNKAKFENNSTSEQLAVQIVKAEKAIGANFIANRNEDAQEAGGIPAAQADLDDPKDKSTEKVSALVAAMGGAKQ